MTASATPLHRVADRIINPCERNDMNAVKPSLEVDRFSTELPLAPTPVHELSALELKEVSGGTTAAGPNAPLSLLAFPFIQTA